MASVSGFQQYIQLAKEMGAENAKIISTKNIAIRNAVLMKCKFGCGGYGKRLTCPPNSPTPDETRKIVSEYKHALLLHFRRASPEKERDKITWDHFYIGRIISHIERRMFLDGHYLAWGMGGGPCELCRTCADKCRHPRKARPSMEACGIDVYATARKADMPINVVTSYEQTCDLYGLILIE